MQEIMKPIVKNISLTDSDKVKKTLEDILKNESFEDLSATKNIDKVYGLYLKKEETKSKKLKGKIDQEINSMMLELNQSFGLDNKYVLINAVPRNRRAFAVQMCKELEAEYQVKTASEKALVQSAVEGFVRSMKCASMLDANRSASLFVAPYIAIYTKEAERAQGQFLKALRLLQQMKTPPLNVTINTKNAFVATNQQNNATVNTKNNDQQ